MREEQFDSIVIGAGLGGLLSAVQLRERGHRVVILERLPHCGGRFTAKTFQGAQVSTGAVHMIPFGSSGVLADMLNRLHVPHRIHDADVFASFHVHGRQFIARTILGTARFMGLRQFAQFVMLGCEMLLRPTRTDEATLSFQEWLDRRIDRHQFPEIYRYFERICHFALSLTLDQISYREVVATTKNMFRYGPPGIVEGGCAALTGALEQRVRDAGATLRLRQDVIRILSEGGQVTGVHVRDRESGEEILLRAPLVVSNIGPRATAALLDMPLESAMATSKASSGEAIGLKVHVLSDVSLIPHRGIMFCLDTQRIAGVVQPSNSDPRLAPPGKHLLITHQVIQSGDLETERKMALDDLHFLFGEAFTRHCRVLTMSAYRGEWPVNRAMQGRDFTPQTALAGLYLVGDAVKPSGYLMVEGVAQSVNYFLNSLDQIAPVRSGNLSAIPPQPSRLRALRWLLPLSGS